MKCFSVQSLFLLLLCSLWKLSVATRVQGILQDSFIGVNAFNHFYLSRFGVAAGSSVYAFGTVRLDKSQLIPLDSQVLLAFIPQDVTNDLVQFVYEGGSNVLHCNTVIPAVLNDSISVGDKKCFSGFKDYLRKVPCDSENENYASCNQPESVPIVHGSDFTFHVDPTPDTEYYYLFLIACKRNTTVSCTWDPTMRFYLSYDISLVHSDSENNSNFDPFTYHFSYDIEGALVILMVFSAVYACVIVTHMLLHSRLCAKGYKMHRLPALFTLSLFIEFFHVVFEMVHMAVFANNGIGAVWCNYIGEVFNQFSDWLLILVLLLIGRGWMITTSTLRSKKVTFTLWGAYVFFFSIYFIWTVLQDQVYPLSITTQHPYQSWPGGFYLAYRLFLLLCILYEMRHVYLVEDRPEKLKLYIVLSVLYIIWFCYLPLIVFVAAFINPVNKYRVILSFALSFDFMANVSMVLLFVPRWSKVFFQFDSHLNYLQEPPFKKLKDFHYGSSETTPSVI